jgi:hypothetical protein
MNYCCLDKSLCFYMNLVTKCEYCTVYTRALTPRRSRWNKWNIYVRLEVSKAVTVKNAVFWDIKTQFVPHRGHIRSCCRHQLVNIT